MAGSENELARGRTRRDGHLPRLPPESYAHTRSDRYGKSQLVT